MVGWTPTSKIRCISPCYPPPTASALTGLTSNRPKLVPHSSMIGHRKGQCFSLAHTCLVHLSTVHLVSPAVVLFSLSFFSRQQSISEDLPFGDAANLRGAEFVLPPAALRDAVTSAHWCSARPVVAKPQPSVAHGYHQGPPSRQHEPRGAHGQAAAAKPCLRLPCWRQRLTRAFHEGLAVLGS